MELDLDVQPTIVASDNNRILNSYLHHKEQQQCQQQEQQKKRTRMMFEEQQKKEGERQEHKKKEGVSKKEKKQCPFIREPETKNDQEVPRREYGRGTPTTMFSNQQKGEEQDRNALMFTEIPFHPTRKYQQQDEHICRICLGGQEEGVLQHPCRCNGTMKFVHKSCLNKWRELAPLRSSRTKCERCQHQYQFGEVPSHMRSNILMQSISVFVETLEIGLFPLMNFAYFYILIPFGIIYLGGHISNYYASEKEKVNNEEFIKFMLRGEIFVSLVACLLNSSVTSIQFMLELMKKPQYVVPLVLEKTFSTIISMHMWNKSPIFRIVFQKYAFCCLVRTIIDIPLHKSALMIVKKYAYITYLKVKSRIGLRNLEKYSPDLLNFEDGNR